MLQNFIKNRIFSYLPFVPTDGQEHAITLISQFLTSAEDHRCFVLSGYAGTGKSSVVGALVKAMEGLNLPCVLLAPTGRAAKVLSHYANSPAYTIHKYIYRREKNAESFSLGFNKLSHALFIVDEASMISAERDNTTFGTGCLLEDLIRFVNQGHQCSLLFLGDEAQLPPVGHVQSPALDTDYLAGYGLSVHHARLTEVARQACESGILVNATNIRNSSEANLTEAHDVHLVDGASMVDAIEKAYREVGIEETIIITRSNKRTNLYNQGIRTRFLGKEDMLSAGDRIMVSRNNYFFSEQYKDLPFLANGDMFTVIRLRNEREMYGFHFMDASLQSIDYEWEIDVILWMDTLLSESPEMHYTMQRELYAKIAEDYPEIRNRKELNEKIMTSPYYNALQVRYAYAITCHKSQGGQWKRVFIDEGMPPKQGITPAEHQRWLYTAVTRATEEVYFLKVTS